VHCKFGGEGRKRNIVELAEVGDWILGTGGSSTKSAGNGKLIYFMRVDEKLTFKQFLSDPRFRGRSDCLDLNRGNLYALISQRYFYFGKNALDITGLPSTLVRKGLVKKGAGFRRDYPASYLEKLIKWFEQKYAIGMHGKPCA
jgi:hypothetical protein